MKRLVVALAIGGLAASAMAAAQEMPQALAALAEKAQLGGPVAEWCRAEFRSGQPGAFAVAVASAAGGRYVALHADGRATLLGAFKGGPDLSCYSSREAQDLDDTIRQSETVQGRVRPRWKTTVVCGFIDETSAACWQYAPDDRVFVQVGAWIT